MANDAYFSNPLSETSRKWGGGLKKLNTYIKHSLVSFPYLTKTEKCLECNYVQVSLANIFA